MSTDLQAIIVTDVEERFVPPEMDCLQVGFVDGIVFLSIGHYEETHDSSTFTREKTFACEATELMNAITFARVNEYNAAQRELPEPAPLEGVA